MKRSAAIAFAIVSIVFGGVGGYWVGFKRGVAVGDAASAVTFGDLAMGEIRLLDAGKPDKARYFLEVQVDDGLVGWSELTSSPATRASLSLLGSRGESYQSPWLSETFVRRLAKYRSTHPSPGILPKEFDDIAAQCRGETGCWDLRPLREREATVASMAAKYAH
jgi:hypothetical protein